MMQRRILFIVAMLFTVATSYAWESKLVQYDKTTGKLIYNAEPVSGEKIADFSVAGYKGGGVALPTVEVKKTIEPISGDNAKHIQDAIDEVGRLPLDANGLRGALLLKPGTYTVDKPIYINKSGVVLRGSGQGFNPNTNTIIIGSLAIPRDNDAVIELGGSDIMTFRRELSGTKSDISSDLVETGSKKFRVTKPHLYKKGDNIMIYHPCTQKWLDAIDGGGTATDDNWKVGEQPIVFNTRITDIIRDTVFIKSPVFYKLDKSLSQSYIYKIDTVPMVRNSGIENIRVNIEYHTGNKEDEDHTKSAVFLSCAENAWVTNSTFQYFWYAGVDIEYSNYITVKDCKAINPISTIDGGRRYNYCVSYYTHNTLFENCYAENGRHSFVSNGTSKVAGIVFTQCTSVNPHSPSEGHRRFTTGMLFDQIVDKGTWRDNIDGDKVMGFYNRGDYGTGHGWSNANSVIWNCDVRRENGTDGKIFIQRPPTAQNFAIGCKGRVTGAGPFDHPTGYIEGSNVAEPLEPASLYQAQLAYRLSLESSPTGIKVPVVSTESKVAIYPNPTEERFTIESMGKDISEVAIYTMSGQLVYHSMSQVRVLTINEPLNAGVYLVRVKDVDARIATHKLVVE